MDRTSNQKTSGTRTRGIRKVGKHIRKKGTFEQRPGDTRVLSIQIISRNKSHSKHTKVTVTIAK